ncbi:Protein TrpH [Chlamydiales bacterium STE3]|nr:Protein TrpH [Chlamydiales bacterium STE3]
MSLLNEFRADLHCHSTFSDGSLSPEEIVNLAKAIKLSGLSITDHDTFCAYPKVFEYAEASNIAMIPGIEFSAMHKGKSVHILGYSFDIYHPCMAGLCAKHKNRRTERNRSILEKLARKGMRIEESDLLSLHVIGRPHIAQAMVNKGYIESVQEAFRKFLADDKPCFAQGEPVSVEETLDVIHQAKGLAIIAHPHLIKDASLLYEVLKMPIDGIECYYARFPETDHHRWLRLASKKDLIITGGSDFHGAIKPNIPLGSSWIDKESFTILEQHYKKNR